MTTHVQEELLAKYRDLIYCYKKNFDELKNFPLDGYSTMHVVNEAARRLEEIKLVNFLSNNEANEKARETGMALVESSKLLTLLQKNGISFKDCMNISTQILNETI